MDRVANHQVYAYIDQEGGYGQALAAGLQKAWRHHPGLQLRIADASRAGRPGWLRRGDGFLITPNHDQAATLLRDHDSPTILLSNRYPDLPQPVISADRVAGGRLAARFFIERGFRCFVYLGHASVGALDERLQGFSAELIGAQLAPPVLCTSEEELRQELPRLPRPFALFAAVDSLAAKAVRVCQAAGLVIPGEAAVCGMDDHRALCDGHQPPLASIATSGEGIAEEGLRALLAWLEGQPPTWRRRVVPPRGIVERASADTVAVADPLVAETLLLLREHIRQPLSVPELADRLRVKRRTLEVHFRRSMGTSIHATGLAIRLDRACILLADADRVVAEVARATGFAGTPQFHVAFRKRFGCTPRAYHAARLVPPRSDAGDLQP